MVRLREARIDDVPGLLVPPRRRLLLRPRRPPELRRRRRRHVRQLDLLRLALLVPERRQLLRRRWRWCLGRRRPHARELLADAQRYGGLVGHITIFESTSDLLPAWLIKVEPPATRVLVRVRDVLVRRPVDDDRAPLRIGAARAAAAAHWRPPRRRRSPKAARALQNDGIVTHSGRGEFRGSPKPVHSPYGDAGRTSPNFRVPLNPGSRSRDAPQNQAQAEAERSPESARAQ